MAPKEIDAAKVESSVLDRIGHGPLRAGSLGRLFLASFAALFFELVVIRYLSTEVRVFAYLKNLALIASFFGIGFGMILQKPPAFLKRNFHWIAAGLFLVITYAVFLHLTFLPVPTGDYRMFMSTALHESGSWFSDLARRLLSLLAYLIAVTGIMYLVVGFFTVIGGLVGENLQFAKPLEGYGLNLVGSLMGIAAFTVLSFLSLPPPIWVGLGFLALVPFFLQRRIVLVVFAATIAAMSPPQSNTYWSPYYRITVTPIPPPPGWPSPAAYFVDVNHLFHQRILDLSPAFLAQYPNATQNSYGRPMYELPYRLVPNPGRVLVIGAGTGNDVAAALRHGASHVDAVEIDPVIFRLGEELHPEHPYQSPKVTMHIDDARVFLRNAPGPYDLIVFGYLDSHTMLSSLSSIRLDNYVYTVESLRDARRLLTPGGTLVLGFSAGETFLGDRLYATLERAFDAPPLAYLTGYDTTGVVFVEGQAAHARTIFDFPEIGAKLGSHLTSTIIATDHWPFLYLESHTIPVAIWTVLVLFLYSVVKILSRNISLHRIAGPEGLHMFFLGAGFMLLETRGVTELSLLFGSTWIVNSVVVAAFLIMGILANAAILARPLSRIAAYTFLFLLLAAGLFIPYSVFAGFSPSAAIVASASFAAAPVFFSGLIFSRAFKDVANPSEALGINLLGAMVGGVLENLVMVGGTPLLGVLAIGLYALSALFSPGSRFAHSFSLPQEKATPVLS
ncbi:MAG TPA: hypothetical protein VE291_03075 [Terracidiphilus sp.]|nr:hypothetical protein [Terracidiphilus sp.]